MNQHGRDTTLVRGNGKIIPDTLGNALEVLLPTHVPRVECLERARTGAVPLDGFISGSYPLARAAAAFGDYERDPDRVLRLLIVP